MMMRAKVSYEVLEWIESGANSYVQTDIYPNNLDDFEIKWLKNSTTNSVLVFGVREGSSYAAGAYYALSYGNIGTTYHYYLYNTDKSYGDAYNYAYNAGSLTDKQPHVIRRIGTNVTYDGAIMPIRGGASKVISTSHDYIYPLVLFGYNAQGAPSGSPNIRLFYFNISTKASLVAVRRISDQALGLYDTIHNKFYPAGGAGAFTAGPIIGTI